MHAIVMVAAMVVCGVAVLRSATVRRWRLSARIRDARRYPLRELPESTPGRVVGVAQALGPTLRAPLSGRACVAYEVSVFTGDNHRIVHEHKAVPFSLVSDGARAIVDPAHAQLALVVDLEASSGLTKDPSPAAVAFLAAHGVEHRGWLLDRSLRYTEAAIAIGETIAVVGTSVREPDPDGAPAGYRGDAPVRVRLSGSAAHPLLISDTPWTTD